MRPRQHLSSQFRAAADEGAHSATAAGLAMASSVTVVSAGHLLGNVLQRRLHPLGELLGFPLLPVTSSMRPPSVLAVSSFILAGTPSHSSR
jgi:hypothetical protein